MPVSRLTGSPNSLPLSVLCRIRHNSDRGCHYRWPGWIEHTESAGLIRSMSKKGCSPDNSAWEGFFGRLKNEMFYCRSWEDTTIEYFIKEVNQYIHWYNENASKCHLAE